MRRRLSARKSPAAASAYPPGVAEAEARACRFVLENAGVTCRRLVDEVSAAQALLQVREGAIVDVGGGSTGVGVVENGRPRCAERQARRRPSPRPHSRWRAPSSHRTSRKAQAAGGREVSSILRPGVERIANSIGRQIAPRMVEADSSRRRRGSRPRRAGGDQSLPRRRHGRLPPLRTRHALSASL